MNVQSRIQALQRKHAELHKRIEVLYAEKAPEIYINTLKAEKLAIKDEIMRLNHV